MSSAKGISRVKRALNAHKRGVENRANTDNYLVFQKKHGIESI